MLRRGSVEHIKDATLVREANKRYLVVAMQVYPRFLPKSQIDEYQRSLSPEANLFAEYRNLHKQYNAHETAFHLVNYERRFSLTPEGLGHLERLSLLAKHQDVYLICQCKTDQHCHVDFLLLMAQNFYVTQIAQPPFSYEEFVARLSGGKLQSD